MHSRRCGRNRRKGIEMDRIPPFNPRSDVWEQRDEPGLGDDVACIKCGARALDTGLECDECGYDNYEAVTGKPFGATSTAQPADGAAVAKD